MTDKVMANIAPSPQAQCSNSSRKSGIWRSNEKTQAVRPSLVPGVSGMCDRRPLVVLDVEGRQKVLLADGHCHARKQLRCRSACMSKGAGGPGRLVWPPPPTPPSAARNAARSAPRAGVAKSCPCSASEGLPKLLGPRLRLVRGNSSATLPTPSSFDPPVDARRGRNLAQTIYDEPSFRTGCRSWPTPWRKAGWATIRKFWSIGRMPGVACAVGVSSWDLLLGQGSSTRRSRRLIVTATARCTSPRRFFSGVFGLGRGAAPVVISRSKVDRIRAFWSVIFLSMIGS